MLAHKDDPIVTEIWVKASEYGLHSVVAIAEACGIQYNILVRRMQSPNKFTVWELHKLHETLKIDLGEVAKSIKKGSIRRDN